LAIKNRLDQAGGSKSGPDCRKALKFYPVAERVADCAAGKRREHLIFDSHIHSLRTNRPSQRLSLQPLFKLYLEFDLRRLICLHGQKLAIQTYFRWGAPNVRFCGSAQKPNS
jgi:hypothetical protein